MPLYLKSSFLLIFISFFSQAQVQPKKELKPDYIHILYADHATTNAKYPGKQLLAGNVKIEHNGATLICDKAIVDKATNTAIAVGKVHLMQGDTLEMKAGFLKYDGNKSFAEAFDKVFLKDPKISLMTDTLFFDRQKQETYYVSGGTIVDSINRLCSEQGQYFLEKKLFRFKHNVHIDNPDYQLDSYQLDYYADSGVSNFYGPTKIYNSQSYIYAEKGHYDSKKKISWFIKNAFIKHKYTTIKGDSLFYDQKAAFATGNKNVILHDSINKTWIFTDAAQRWINLDSTRVQQDPLVVNITNQDTLFIRANQFVTTGKEEQRQLWGYPNVRFYSKDFSGKADSIYQNEQNRILKLLKKPVLWSGESQITGEKILLKNDSLKHLDSIIIPKNVFIIQKDSLGFNQIKGNKLLGKFDQNLLQNIDISGNTEMIYFLREDDGALSGIEKNKSSRIYIIFDDGKIAVLRLYTKTEGTIYPYKDLLKQNQKFKGFNWRGNEQIKSKSDIIGDKKLLYDAETHQLPTQFIGPDMPLNKD